MIPLKFFGRSLGLSVTMLAFAANSILCRMALNEHNSDATIFSLVRLASGAVALWFLVFITRAIKGSHYSIRATNAIPANTRSARQNTFTLIALPSLALLTYVWGFSVAYQWLSAGTGALILFGCVQLTLVFISIISGEAIRLREWLGLGFACGGLYYLLHNSIEHATGFGYFLMSIAGVAWGIYTYQGKRAREPILQTAINFTAASLFIGVSVALFVIFKSLDICNSISSNGLLLAIASGAITSGGGYALWYTIVKKISTTAAGVAQLSVPVLTAIAGAIFLQEEFTPTMIISSIMILTGVYLTQTRVRK